MARMKGAQKVFFLDRKEQSHLLFQCYLPKYQFCCRFERFSNTSFSSLWGGGGDRPPCFFGYASDFRLYIPVKVKNM